MEGTGDNGKNRPYLMPFDQTAKRNAEHECDDGVGLVGSEIDGVYGIGRGDSRFLDIRVKE